MKAHYEALVNLFVNYIQHADNRVNLDVIDYPQINFRQTLPFFGLMHRKPYRMQNVAEDSRF